MLGLDGILPQVGYVPIDKGLAGNSLFLGGHPNRGGSAVILQLCVTKLPRRNISTVAIDIVLEWNGEKAYPSPIWLYFSQLLSYYCTSYCNHFIQGFSSTLAISGVRWHLRWNLRTNPKYDNTNKCPTFFIFL